MWETYCLYFPFWHDASFLLILATKDCSVLDLLIVSPKMKIRMLHGLKHLVSHSNSSELLWLSSLFVEKPATLLPTAKVISPDFLKKYQIQPNSHVQWQIANFILEFKYTYPNWVNYDGVRVGSVCLHLNQ